MKTIYRADDGTIFESEKECLDYENQQREHTAWEKLIGEFLATKSDSPCYGDPQLSDRAVAHKILNEAKPFLGIPQRNKLWLVERTDDVGYDEYDSVIVAAPDVETARSLEPAETKGMFQGWSEELNITCIGSTDLPNQIIHKSFNAG